MRVLLDTNVLIAAFVARGLCHELLEHCEREHELVTSAFILGELEERLLGKFKVPAAKARAAVQLIRTRSVLVEPEPLEAQASRDPDDDWVLASALAGACQCIATGDKDRLDLGEYTGGRILSPRDFWRYEAAAAG